MPGSRLTGQTWRSMSVDLPIVRLTDDLAISLLMVTDAGVAFGAHAGTCLAGRLAPLRPDIVVGAATLGIPIAIEVTRALGFDRHVIVQKSPKRHLVGALSEHVSSIASSGPQRLLLDRHCAADRPARGRGRRRGRDRLEPRGRAPWSARPARASSRSASC